MGNQNPFRQVTSWPTSSSLVLGGVRYAPSATGIGLPGHGRGYGGRIRLWRVWEGLGRGLDGGTGVRGDCWVELCRIGREAADLCPLNKMSV